MRIIPIFTDSLYAAVGAASVSFSAMDATKYKNYVFTTTTDCFIKQGTGAQTAAAAAGNIAVKAGQELILDTRMGTTVAVIQASAGGHATLAPVAYIVR